MRVLLDTNVWIAAFLSRGVCHELVEHCKRGHTLVTSEFILGELEEKLVETFGVPPEKAWEARALIEASAEWATPQPLNAPVSRDPDDDEVLAAASGGACRCVVTGDQDLLVLEDHQGIRIVSPRGFWRFEASERESSNPSLDER